MNKDLPLNIKKSDMSVINSESIGLFTSAPPNIFKKNVFVTRSGIGLKRLRLIIETIPHYKSVRWHFYKYALLQFFLRPKRKLRGEYILIHNHWCPGYYHWLTEALPRLWRAKDALKTHTLLLPELFKNTPLESLEPFNPKIEWIKGKENLQIENLLIPENTQFTAWYDVESLIGIRNLYRSYLVDNKLDSLNLGEKIYVTRKKAKQRKVSNEKELIEYIKNEGYCIVAFEDYNFWEQVSIMYHASVLVSIHGAGLTNQLFMKENSIVYELQKKLYSNEVYSNIFLKLSNVLGHKYLYQFCEPVNSVETIYSADICVDMSELKSNITIIDNMLIQL